MYDNQIVSLTTAIISIGVLWLIISSAVSSGVYSALRKHARDQQRRRPRQYTQQQPQEPQSFDITE